MTEFFKMFLSFPVTRPAVRTVLEKFATAIFLSKTPVVMTHRFLEFLKGSDFRLHLIAIDCWAAYLQKDRRKVIEDTFIGYVEAHTGQHLLCKMAEYDVENKTETLANCCVVTARYRTDPRQISRFSQNLSAAALL